MISSVPDLLCPVDFSRRSRHALTYALALADHFKARLRVLTIADETGRVTGLALNEFIAEVLQGRHLRPAPELVLRDGNPADEIVDAASDPRTDLIIMATHGGGRARGAYGSTAAYVLAHAPVPVLVAPAGSAELPAPDIASFLAFARTILAPVDFNERARHDAAVAAGLAVAFGLPLLLLHVVGPDARTSETDARLALRALAEGVRTRVPIEALVARGDPAIEIARLAAVRQAGAIVMGLRGDDGAPGWLPGAIAYEVLCRAPSLVLALPPALEWRPGLAQGPSAAWSPV